MVTQPTIELESTFWDAGRSRVVGVDEVGLGCLAGPIVSAAVLLPVKPALIPIVRDSKALSARQRLQAFEAIQAQAIAIGIGLATVAEIEQVNVLQASYLAMRRAIARVQAIHPVDHALIDGRAIAVDLGVPVTTLIKGDAQCYSIACASIVAKVRRDRLMQRLAKRYPGYGWERNAGYGTRQHLQGIATLGITPWHRKTYAPVKAVYVQQELFADS